ncbi:MAG: PilZ domain-containing protein [Planctomycetes bacterium]|nr:PilZ domain-containing protein [Planctomycetota bacterium]
MIFTRKPPARRKVESRAITEEEWVVLASPAPDSKPYGGVDRRRRRRATHRAIMHLYLETSSGEDSERYLVRTRNLSDTGVGFIHAEPVQPGTRCQIALLDLDHQLVRRRGMVACSAGSDDGLFHVGVRFDEPINPADFVRPESFVPQGPRRPA